MILYQVDILIPLKDIIVNILLKILIHFGVLDNIVFIIVMILFMKVRVI